MTDDLRALYQEMILDHSKHPHNRGALPAANRRADGYNPLCGDRVRVELDVDDGVIRDVAFDGSGCAISTASASMMTDAVRGRSERDARALFAELRAVVTGQRPADVEVLDRLAVFAGVSRFPMRVKCATLPWHTLLAALDRADQPVSTETAP